MSNAATPYRINLHRRLVRECADLQIRSVFTHEYSNARWSLSIPEEILPVSFGAGEASESQGFTQKPLHEFRKGCRIIQYLRSKGVDAVILFGYNDWCRLALLAWCRLRRIPCFIFGDSNLLCEATSGVGIRLKRAILPAILKCGRGVMHCGVRGSEYFRRYGVPGDRIFPFPYEPDYSQTLTLSAAARERAVRMFGLDAGRRRMVYSGRLVSIKRVDLLISAFEAISSERPDWDLIVAGDGPLRSQLAASVSARLIQRVQFLGFINEPQDLAAVYCCSDVLVLPSDCEPWGVVVTEAAACLALVCSSRVGAAKDLVEDNVNGRVFDAGDAVAIEQALREVTDPLNIDRMKAASPAVLSKWRARTDPVAGLRQALRSVGLVA